MPHLVPLWMTMSPSPLPLDRQKWSLKWNRFVQLARFTIACGLKSKLGARLRSLGLFITVCSFRLFACLRKFRNAETFWSPPGIKIYLFPNKLISFELIFSAHSTVGELGMHNDIWRHQEDIPWAHSGCVWKRKRRCHFANRSMEETGQLISSRNLKVIWVWTCIDSSFFS